MYVMLFCYVTCEKALLGGFYLDNIRYCFSKDVTKNLPKKMRSIVLDFTSAHFSFSAVIQTKELKIK
jgi:hypothetical protein